MNKLLNAVSCALLTVSGVCLVGGIMVLKGGEHDYGTIRRNTSHV